MKVSLLLTTTTAIRFLPPQSFSQAEANESEVAEIFEQAAEAEQPPMLAETNQAVKEKKEANSNRGGVDYTRFLNDNYDYGRDKRLSTQCYEKDNKVYGHEVYKKEI